GGVEAAGTNRRLDALDVRDLQVVHRRLDQRRGRGVVGDEPQTHRARRDNEVRDVEGVLDPAAGRAGAGGADRFDVDPGRAIAGDIDLEDVGVGTAAGAGRIPAPVAAVVVRR